MPNHPEWKIGKRLACADITLQEHQMIMFALLMCKNLARTDEWDSETYGTIYKEVFKTLEL